MPKKIIHLTERELKTVVKDAALHILEEELEEEYMLTEMAISINKFANNLHGKVFHAFTNLACIYMFRDIVTQPLIHWAERATEPFIPWFSQEVTNETTGRRTTAVNKAFNMMFNEGYSAITVKSFKDLITYYANRPNKKERIFATNNADYYYNTYKGIIVQKLEIMKKCLIDKDYELWCNTVNGILEETSSEV